MPTEVEAIVRVILMGDALEHTTVTGGVIVVSVTGDTMENILQTKSIHYINFLWLKIGILLEKCNSSYPWPGAQDTWYKTDIWTSDRHKDAHQT